MDSKKWLKSAAGSHDKFKQASSELSQAVYNLFMAGLPGQAETWIDTYRSARELAPKDPSRHTWAFTMAQLLVMSCAHLLDAREFDRAAEHLTNVQKAIKAQEVCWPEHRWTAIRLKRDHCLAQLKWLAGEEWYGLITEPSGQIQWWLDTLNYIDTWQAEYPDQAAVRLPSLSSQSMQAGVNILKLALRYCPARFPELVAVHNSRFSLDLPLRAGDARNNEVKHCAYWELAMALESVKVNASPRLLLHYAERFVDAVSATDLRSRAVQFSRAIHAECAVLIERSTSRRNLTVVGNATN